MNRWGKSRAKVRAKTQNRDLQDSSWSDRIYWNYRRNHRAGGSGKNLGQEEPMPSCQSYIYIYKIPPVRKRDILKLPPKSPGEESGKNLGQEGPMPSSQSYIYIYIKFRQPAKEKILSEGTRQKAKYCNYIFSISLNLKKEERKQKGRKSFTFMYYPLTM